MKGVPKIKLLICSMKVKCLWHTPKFYCCCKQQRMSTKTKMIVFTFHVGLLDKQISMSMTHSHWNTLHWDPQQTKEHVYVSMWIKETKVTWNNTWLSYAHTLIFLSEILIPVHYKKQKVEWCTRLTLWSTYELKLVLWQSLARPRIWGQIHGVAGTPQPEGCKEGWGSSRNCTRSFFSIDSSRKG